MTPDGRSLRVVLVGDDRFSRDGLRGMFETDGAETVDVAASLAEALAFLRAEQADVVVVDPSAADGEPSEWMAQLVAVTPDVRVAVLTDSAAEHEVLAALGAGAVSYLLKTSPAEELVAAIRQTAAGSTVLAAGAARGVLAGVVSPRRGGRRQQGPRAELSARESEVLAMIVDGADNGEIGQALSISRHTVKQHVTNIFDKLGVRTRVQAAVLAVRDDLL
ncbi:MAG TPA: response regulator transcription factor [Solirubrobacteraceae bacterium]|nr:response regulator transcription factor [Solirubrobacteraceae bacterium]